MFAGDGQAPKAVVSTSVANTDVINTDILNLGAKAKNFKDMNFTHIKCANSMYWRSVVPKPSPYINVYMELFICFILRNHCTALHCTHGRIGRSSTASG